MKTVREPRAFSLIEVVVAVGVFAGAVAVIIGLMGALARQSADSLDHLAAQRLPAAVRVELQRLAAAGFDSLAGRIPLMAAPLGEGLALAASRETAGVESLAYLPPPTGRLAADEQYFLVECWRFQAEPLRSDPGKAFLALHVRISWPYRLPAIAGPVPLADRRQLTFTVSLNR